MCVDPAFNVRGDVASDRCGAMASPNNATGLNRSAGVLASARVSAAASSADEVKTVSPASTRPGNRVVISWKSQPFLSGSLNDAYEP